MTPRVSVVMPVLDAEPFVREAVESVLGQTFGDLELVAVDDGSTDGSADALRELAARDARVRVHAQAHGGLAAALNAGLALAAAPLVARMDADDVALPDRLERQVALLDAQPDAALVAGGLVVVDEDGRELDTAIPPAAPDLLAGNPIPHPTVVFRTDAVRALGGYRLDQAEDYDLWLRLEERHRIAVLPEIVLRYRVHRAQFSVRRLERQAVGALVVREAARRRRAGGPDPLDGVARVEDARGALGIDAAEVQASLVSDAVYWATMLRRAGLADDADALLEEAASAAGASRLRLRATVAGRLARMRLRSAGVR